MKFRSSGPELLLAFFALASIAYFTGLLVLDDSLPDGSAPAADPSCSCPTPESP
jgi:hypothetical protein